MTPAEAIIRLAKIGYQFEVRGDRIRCIFRGLGEPDPAQVLPLLKTLRAHKREVLAWLRRDQVPAPETQPDRQGQDIPTCGPCPYYRENHWTHHPGLKGWCGWHWDYLLGPHNPQCRDRREGRVPDPKAEPRETGAVTASQPRLAWAPGCLTPVLIATTSTRAALPPIPVKLWGSARS